MTTYEAIGSPQSPVPLARTRDGTPIDLPEGGAAWRVRRHTGGRPRLHLDGAKQAMQLSLSYTMADLDDILPPGSYKLDLVDRVGGALGVTVDVEIGALRNAGVSESHDLDDSTIALPAAASDVRYLLESNVRSTQLAFQHNQRTLEAGLRMADTLREGIQALAESQAEWIKSLVAARGFPALRNAALHQPLALPAPGATDDDDGDDDADDPEASRSDKWMELGITLANLANNFMARPSATLSGSKPEGSGFDVRSLFDWRRAAKQGEAAKASLGGAPDRPSFASPGEALAALPPELLRKLFEVRAQLSTDEQSRLMQLVSAFPPDELPAIATQMESLSADELLATIRKHIAPTRGE